MTAGRPPIYTDDVRVCLRAEGKYALKPNGIRRAIVQLLLDNNGCLTIGEINSHFHRNMKKTVSQMLRSGWLSR